MLEAINFGHKARSGTFSRSVGCCLTQFCECISAKWEMVGSRQVVSEDRKQIARTMTSGRRHGPGVRVRGI